MAGISHNKKAEMTQIPTTKAEPLSMISLDRNRSSKVYEKMKIFQHVLVQTEIQSPFNKQGQGTITQSTWKDKDLQCQSPSGSSFLSICLIFWVLCSWKLKNLYYITLHITLWFSLFVIFHGPQHCYHWQLIWKTWKQLPTVHYSAGKSWLLAFMHVPVHINPPKHPWRPSTPPLPWHQCTLMSLAPQQQLYTESVWGRWPLTSKCPRDPDLIDHPGAWK